MDYKKQYDLLIQKAKSRENLSGYSEKHHIIPRCLGGNNSKDNIAILTGREHFIAHLLLRKIYPEKTGLTIAVLRMLGDFRRITNSRKYEWVRSACHQKMSEHHTRHANERWQKEEYRQKMSEAIKKSWQNPERIKKGRDTNSKERNPMYGKQLTQKTKELKSKNSGAKPFKVWKAICIKPDSYKGVGVYKKGEFIGVFQLRNEFEKTFGVKRQLIAKCLNKKTPQSGGFIFEFEDSK